MSHIIDVTVWPKYVADAATTTVSNNSSGSYHVPGMKVVTS